MRPKGDHLKILYVLRRAVQRRVVQDFCNEHKIGSTTIYQSTNPASGNPSLRVLCNVVNALGYQLYVRPKKGKNKPMEGYPKALEPEQLAEQDEWAEQGAPDDA